ncbi:MAG: hypothetical protein ABIY37_02110 [Devosia sp.]
MKVSKIATSSRELGEQERLLNYLHRFGGLIVLSVLHIRGRLDRTLLQDALDWIQDQHPILRAHITYGRIVFRSLPPFAYRHPSFVTQGTTKIPLSVVENPNPHLWRQILARELRSPIRRGANPRLRVTLVRTSGDAELSHVIVCADHAIIDAHSANMLSRQLLEYLADPEEARRRVPPHSALPPPLEALLPTKTDSGTRGYEPAIRLPKRPNPNARMETRILSRRLDPEEADRLRVAIKTNRTTLHGAITAAFLLAIRQRYGLEAMSVLTTIDLRRLMKPTLPEGTYGCYIDIVRTTNPIGTDFWKTASEVSFRLIATLARDQGPASILKLFDWEVYRKEIRGMTIQNRRIDGLAVTTAGESGLRSRYGAYELEDVTMAVSLDFFGPSLFVIATERDGGIDLSIGYSASAISDEEVSGLTDSAASLLHQQMSGENPTASRS